MPTYNIWQNQDRGWTLSSLAKELGVRNITVRALLRKKGLRLKTPRYCVLCQEDIETIMAVVYARKSERLYGQ